MNKEIERKWLVKGFPKEAEGIESRNLFVTYLCVVVNKTGEIVKEIRVRRDNGADRMLRLYTVNIDGDNNRWPDKITIKSGGGISRTEIETKLPDHKFFDDVVSESNVYPIHKEYKHWDKDGKKFEISKVDDLFYYAEVEFDSEEEAEAYEFPYPEILLKEVTDDSSFKMAMYWFNNRYGTGCYTIE